MFCETLIMFVLYLCYVLYEAKALRRTVVSMECVFPVCLVIFTCHV